MRSLEGPGQDQLAEFVAPTGQAPDETIRMFEAAGVQMREGDFQGAITTYEAHLSRLGDIPPDQMSSYFGDLGMAYLYQGQALDNADEPEQARHHFERAAFMFEQAAATATYGVIETVATYYRLLALFNADDYSGARSAGELFLNQQPEAAVEAELLPQGITATVKEILSVSYYGLADAETENPQRASTLRGNGLRYSQEAIDEAPDRVIQPYYFVGVDAADRGLTQVAIDRLSTFLSIMGRIPESEWDPEDTVSVEKARGILTGLGASLP